VTRRLGPWAALIAAFILIGSCGREPTGLSTPRGGLLFNARLAPEFASAVLDLGDVRIVLTRPVTEAVVVDTTIPFPASEDSIEVRIEVPLEATTESFTLRVAITDLQGDTVFRIGPTTVVVSENPLIPQTEIPPPTYVGVGSDAAGIRLVSPPDYANFSQAVPIVAEAFDGVGDVIPGTPIGFALVTPADSTRARFLDRGVGSLTTLTTRGDVAVRAYLLTGQEVTHTITVQPVANSIAIASGSGQAATVGTPIAQPVVARVRAADNLGVEGIPVFFRLLHGIDTLSVLWDTTDVNGDAQYTPTLGTIAGGYSVIAGASGVGVAGATLTALAGPSSRLEFTVQPSNVLPATTMTPPVQVTARDAYGNVASAFVNGVTVALLDNPDGAVLAGTLTRTAVGGIATFNDLSLTGTGSGITMRATATSVASDTSAAFAITIGTPTRLEITQQPTDRTATQAFSPPIVVAIRDAGGSTVPSATDDVSIEILSNPSGAVLAGPTTVAAVSGVATFSGLSIAKAGTGYTLRVTSGALASDTSAAFNVGTGPPTQLRFVTQPPAAVTVDVQMTVAVAAEDAGGNVVTSFTNQVTLAFSNNPGGSALSGTVARTAVAGVATFDDIALDVIASGYTLQATAAGVTLDISTPFDVVPPANVVVWTNPAGGAWNVASNWSSGVVPTAADTASIGGTGTYTVTVSTTAVVGRILLGGSGGTQTLALTGGTLTLTDSVFVGAQGAVVIGGGQLTGAGAMQVVGAFTWNAGNIAGGGGSVTTLGAGSFAITGAPARTLSDFTLEMAGAGSWTGSAAIASGSGAVLRVLPTGNLDIQSTGGLFYDQGGIQTIFDVQGSVTRTVATDTVRVAGLTGNGVIGLSTGVLEARNSGTFDGTISIAPAAGLYYSSGTNLLGAAGVVNGNGTVTIGGSATVSVAGTYGLGGLTRLIAGTLDFDAASGFTNDFAMLGGIKGGSGTFDIVNAMTWTAGSVSGGGGTTRILDGASLVIDGAAARLLSNHVIDIAGTALWAPGVRNISSGSAGGMRVLAGGVFDLQGGGGWFYDQGGTQSTLEVSGSLLRTVGTDTMRVPGLTVLAGGSVNAASGVLEARNAATSAGTLSATGTGELRFATGTQTMTASAVVTGDGVVSIGAGGTVTTLGGWAVTGTTRVNGGTLDFDTALGSTTNFEMLSGSKGGAGVLDVTGSLTWSGGNLSGNSGALRVTATGSAAITGTSARSLIGHTLAIAGAGTWTGSFSLSSGSGGIISVLPGGSLDIQGDPGWFYDQGGAQSVFDVQGTVTRSVSTGVAIVPGLSVSGSLVVSSGVLEARNIGTSAGTLTAGAGAELRLASGTHDFSGTSLIDGAGLVHVSAGTMSSSGGWAVTGTTRVSGGTMNHNGAGGTTAVLQVAGGVKGGAGVLGVTSAMVWSGGSLQNGGGITRVESGATLDIQGTAARSLIDHTLEIAGSGLWSGSMNLSSGSAGTIRVLPTGSMDIQGNPLWSYDQGGAQSMFDVQGSLTRTVSSGAAIVPGLAVSGTVTVLSGVLESRNASTSSGAYIATAPGELRFGTGNQTLSPATSVSGTGIVSFPAGGHVAEGSWNVTGTTRVNGGSFDYNGASGNTATLEITSGVKGGSGLLIVDGAMSWTGGNISGDGGTTRVGASATLTIAGATGRLLNSHTLEVLGTAEWNTSFTLSSGSSARLRIGAGGVLNVSAAPTFSYDQGGAATMLENLGAMNVNGPGTMITTAQFVGAGAVTVFGGATLDLRGGGDLASSTTTVAAGGVLRYGSGTYTMQPAFAVAGPGLTLLDGATLTGLAPGDTVDIDYLRVQAGTLDPQPGSVVRIGTLLDWGASSTLTGGGTTHIPSSAVLTLTGTLGRTLADHIIDVEGAAVWSDPSIVNAGSGAVIRIRPAAGLTVQPAAATVAQFLYNQGGAGVTLDIQGALILASDATFNVSANLQLSGNATLLDGTLNLTGSGTLANLLSVDASAALNLNGGTYTLADGFVIAGLGLTTLNNATLTNVAVADTAEVGRLRLSLGNVDPNGVLRVSDHLEWAGTTQIGGGTLLVNDTLEITGASGRNLVAATLELEGVTRFTSAATIQSGTGAVIRNMPTGDFEWGDGDYLSNLGGGQSRLENFGALRFTGAGVKQISAFIMDTTSNAFDAQVGTIESSGGGRLGGTVALSGGVLQVTAGIMSLQEGTTIGGGSIFRVTGGTLAADTLLSTGVTIEDLDLTGGELSHEGLVTILNSMGWSGGQVESNTIGAGGRTRIATGATLTFSGAGIKNYVGSHVIEIQSGATATYGGSGNVQSGSGPVIENAGIFDMSGTGSMLFNLGGAAPRFRNLAGGDLRRTAVSNVVMNFPIENAGGTLTADADTLRLTGGGVTAFTGAGISNAAPIKLLGNFSLTGNFGVSGTNGGLVVAAGVLQVGPSTLSTTGDLVVTTSGALNSSSAGSIVDVGGNALFNSSSASIMTAGLLRLTGGLTQGPGGIATAFAPSGTHLTTFVGTNRQPVSFSNPGTAASRFNFVDLGGPATPRRIELLTNAFAASWRDTTAASTDSVITGANALLTTGIAELDNIVFSGTRVHVTNGADASLLRGMRFDLMDVAATQLQIDMNATTSRTINQATFATTPTTGFYLHARQMTVGTAPTLSLPLPVTPSSPSSFYNNTANGGVPTRVAITWGGVLLGNNPP
jgi:hypothetical protein